jgi:hypothetical protein
MCTGMSLAAQDLMASRSNKARPQRGRGTRSVTDEHAPSGRHFADDGRKVADLERVGAMAPDTDPDDTDVRPRHGGRGRDGRPR